MTTLLIILYVCEVEAHDKEKKKVEGARKEQSKMRGQLSS
jgi:hypothetical protein